MKILIVESQRVIALELQTTLCDLGHEVVGVAATGDRALETAAVHRPAIAIVAGTLKGGCSSGQLVESLAGSGIRTVVITGHLETDPLLGRHATAILSKPYSADDLIAAIRVAATQYDKAS